MAYQRCRMENYPRGACSECQAAWRNYMRDWRQRQKELKEEREKNSMNRNYSGETRVGEKDKNAWYRLMEHNGQDGSC